MRRESSFMGEEENERGVQARWMKSSFLRLNWPWIISVSFIKGYNALCTIFSCGR